MREDSRNRFVKKGGMPGRFESFVEIDSSETSSRTRLELIKPIRDGLRKKQNLMESRPSRAEPGLAGRENGLRFQKKK